MPARGTPNDEKFSKKTQQQFTIKSIVKQQATRFNQLKTNQNHSTVHFDTQKTFISPLSAR